MLFIGLSHSLLVKVALLLFLVCGERLVRLLPHGSHLLVNLLHVSEQALLVSKPVLSSFVHCLLLPIDDVSIVFM
ncbi:MAG: hypothetical protein ACK56I_34245, partial [bacterium]